MREWIIKDFHWKAFSLLMAIGIWLTVRKETEPAPMGLSALTTTTYDNVPVVAISANADVRQAQLFPQTITATISGAPDVMNSLQRTQIYAFVDLTGINSAQNLARDVQISVPQNATVVSIEPSQITVSITRPP